MHHVGTRLVCHPATSSAQPCFPAASSTQPIPAHSSPFQPHPLVKFTTPIPTPPCRLATLAADSEAAALAIGDEGTSRRRAARKPGPGEAAAKARAVASQDEWRALQPELPRRLDITDPMLSAAYDGDLEGWRWAIESGPGRMRALDAAMVRDGQGRTAVTYAAARGQVQLLRYMVEACSREIHEAWRKEISALQKRLRDFVQVTFYLKFYYLFIIFLPLRDFVQVNLTPSPSP